MRHTFREDGAILVESALTLMTFLMLILGIMESGRLLEVRNTVTEATREGARFAVSPLHNHTSETWTLPTHDEISNQIRQLLSSASIDATAVSVTIDNNFPFPSDPTTVCTRIVVSVPYQVLTPLVPFGGITIRAESVMRNENSN
jgi:Flp pilus assembly protein TadG